MIRARVTVTLKPGVLDPQGKAIEGALAALGFDGVGSVRQGKVFDIELTGDDRVAAEADLEAMCEKLLANTVIENYVVALDGPPPETFLLEEKHKTYFDHLLKSDFGSVAEARTRPNWAGVYAFFDGASGIYVGRTSKRGFGPRMKNHLAKSHNQAVLAFKLAQNDLGISTAYAGENIRSELVKKQDFLDRFYARIEYVSTLTVKFVEIANSDDQYIFEYYASKRLRTPHNDFNTH